MIAGARPRPTLTAALWRRRAVFAAGAALAVTLALGQGLPQPAGPGIAVIASLAGLPVLAGLAAVAAVGLIAFHLARLTAVPVADLARAGLPGTLAAAALLPNMGVAALGVPMILSLLSARHAPEQRVVALLVHCGAIASIAASAINHVGFLHAGAIFLSFPLVKCLEWRTPAANDNPSLERTGPTLTGCWPPAAVVQEGLGRVRGSGEYLDVQQQ